MAKRLRHIRLFVALVLSLALVGTLAACGGKTQTSAPSETPGTQAPSAGKAEGQIQITDAAGRTVTLSAPAKRVVAIGPGALRLVTYVDGMESVVGVEQIEKGSNPGKTYGYPFKDRIEALPVIGQGGPDTPPNVEKIVEVKPDVIFAVQPSDAKGADDLQAKTGVPVIVLSYGPLGTLDKPLFTSIQNIGKALGKEKRAQEVVDFIEKTMADLKQRTKDIPDAQKPTVYVGGLGFKGGHGITSTQKNFPPFVLTHAKNVAAALDKDVVPDLDREKLVEWNPDIIFLDLGNLKLVTDDYQKERQFYESLKAVKDKKVFGIYPFNYYNTNVETALWDAYIVGKVLYPDKFQDVDLTKKGEEIYAAFFGEAGKKIPAELEKAYGKAGAPIDLSKPAGQQIELGK
ncbi:iron ABC transporter substrate-binding protein [Brockia lithotrophica]|uniref:Iron complex transport system substrate-binding protein n=1 Tax=Brockia lithotrophica TaxID=933949 RepID=A0A660L404_9BACL|nr:iron ABC transporter substrate-binding protein [Brockia lithotrophica]RKQ88636.1 iron complex transport system substrate-binding protein [Brockia lithotrophica]